jgi:hypothetical protein
LSELARFQDDFARALLGDPAPAGWGDSGAIEDGLAVYRNTVIKGVLDALEASFPTVVRLVGEEWFRASAQASWLESPPLTPVLADYGEGYPAFLARFVPAQDIPYLAGVARIDRMWTEAHFAADAAVLSPATVAALDAKDLQATQLRLHPSVRIAWFDEPAPSIWRLNRPPAPAPEPIEIEWRGEGALLTRPLGAVEMLILDRSGFAFLGCCAAGAKLGECAVAALAADPKAPLKSYIAAFFAAGVFSGEG